MLETFFSLVNPATCVVLGVALTTAIFWIAKTLKQPANLPPGPPQKRLLFSNMHLLKSEGMQRMDGIIDIVKKYGCNGVATVQVATQKQVFVTDYETIKRILSEDAFTGRPKLHMIDRFFNRKGLLFTDGPLWREHRRFALTTLRDFGMGKTWLQDLIIEEAQELINDIESQKNKPVNPTSFLTPSVSNVICAIAYGKRFDHRDEKFRRLTTLLGQNVQLNARNAVLQFFPFLRLIPFSVFRQRYLEGWKNQMEVMDFLQTLVDEHKLAFQQGEARDYIDAYMNESAKQKTNPNSTFTKEQLEKSIANLFGAGTETTSTTLTWAILYLLENPECYKKVQEEVDRVIPDGSFPNLEEKENLPYLQATIMEVQRIANLVPAVGRVTMEQTEINGFVLPVNTWVIPILYAVHMDPKYFPDPKKFDPTRFLDEQGKIKQKVEGFIPFSVGKRFCLGESLAKMELYLFFASLVKYFTFRVPPGKSISSKNSILGIVNSPLPFEIVFEPRTGRDNKE